MALNWLALISNVCGCCDDDSEANPVEVEFFAEILNTHSLKMLGQAGSWQFFFFFYIYTYILYHDFLTMLDLKEHRKKIIIIPIIK